MSQVDHTGEPSERAQPDGAGDPAQLLEQLVEMQDALDARLETMGADPQQEWFVQTRALGELRSSWEVLYQHAKRIADGEPHPLLSVENATREALYQWLGNHAAWTAGELAVRYGLAGQSRDRLQLLAAGATIAADERLALELGAAEREPETHAALIQGRWLHRHKRYDEADKVLTAAKRSANQQVLQDALADAINAPRPITSAPSMGSVNGVGTMLFGRRDEQEDGSYISTLFFTVVFVPILPLAAYRVERAHDGYLFHGRVPLSPLTRWWRRLAAATLVLSLACGVAYSYFGSDTYQAGRAVAAAQEQETAGNAEAALKGYRDVLAEYDSVDDPPQGALEDAGLGIVRIAAADMPEPPAPGDVPRIEGVVGAHDTLPITARKPATTWLVERLLQWGKALGSRDESHARASVEVLDMADELTEQNEKVNNDRLAAHLALARALRKRAPLAALSHYDVALDDPGAVSEAGAIIDHFGDSPSLWVHCADEVRRWAIRARSGSGDHERVERIVAKQSKAQAQYKHNEQLIQENDAAILKEALAAQPKTQELALAVAEAEQAGGHPDKAAARLEELGDPGMLTPATRLALAGFKRYAGDLAAAEQHYEAIVNQRLPLYKSANRRYRRHYEQAIREQWQQLADSPLAPELEEKLRNLGDDAQQQVVFEWVQKEAGRDPALQRLRNRMLSMHDVVAATIALGSLKLQRARAASGDDRRRLLQEAERSMLSMQASAQGLPSYHLSLGEVYHRLGRIEEGDRELAALLERKDIGLTLAVGQVYRNLGDQKRARGIFESAYESAENEHGRFDAAHARSLVSRDLEDKQQWLQRSDKTQPTIKASLAIATGLRALERGDIAEADRQHAEAARLHMATAEHSAAGANNAALALTTRYSLTGDRQYVAKATKLLERALQLSSNDPVVLGNLADQLRYHGTLEVLDTELDVDRLAPGHSGADVMLHLLLHSGEAANVRAVLNANRKLKRSLELLRQQQALAPQNPEPYLAEQLIIGEQRDVQAARKLLERLRGLPALRIDDISESRRDYEAGKSDALMRRSFTGILRLADRAKQSAERSGNKKTAAMAHMLLSVYHSRMTPLDKGQAAEKSLASARKAAALWSDPSTELTASNALFEVALYAAAKQSPALERALKSDSRRIGTVNATITVMQSSSKQETLAALTAQEQLKEALALVTQAAEHTGKPAPTWAYYVASWLEDSDARRRLPAASSSPFALLSLQIEELIYVGEKREELDRQHWHAIAELP